MYFTIVFALFRQGAASFFANVRSAVLRRHAVSVMAGHFLIFVLWCDLFLRQDMARTAASVGDIHRHAGSAERSLPPHLVSVCAEMHCSLKPRDILF